MKHILTIVTALLFFPTLALASHTHFYVTVQNNTQYTWNFKSFERTCTHTELGSPINRLSMQQNGKQEFYVRHYYTPPLGYNTFGCFDITYHYKVNNKVYTCIISQYGNATGKNKGFTFSSDCTTNNIAVRVGKLHQDHANARITILFSDQKN